MGAIALESSPTLISWASLHVKAEIPATCWRHLNFFSIATEEGDGGHPIGLATAIFLATEPL